MSKNTEVKYQVMRAVERVGPGRLTGAKGAVGWRVSGLNRKVP